MQLENDLAKAHALVTRPLKRFSYVIAGLLISAFLVGGALGIGHYVETFWLYRGFAAPTQPTTLMVGSGSSRHKVRVSAGVVDTVLVKSGALGDRSMKVIIYLPPGYGRNAHEHYPVLYLLHGFPGSPAQFINVGDVASTSDVMLAEHLIQPMIVVMPSGSTSFFVGNEWANSILPHNDWETYIAQDLVKYVDQRYLADTNGSERAIVGLSEGAYGSLNIGFHHVGEFGLMESWSGYFNADHSPRLFGNNVRLLDYNSPSYEVHVKAAALRSSHSYIWLFSGTRDDTKHPTIRFNLELSLLHINHGYAIHSGRHTWALWRAMMPKSLIVASRYFDGNHVSP